MKHANALPRRIFIPVDGKSLVGAPTAEAAIPKRKQRVELGEYGLVRRVVAERQPSVLVTPVSGSWSKRLPGKMSNGSGSASASLNKSGSGRGNNLIPVIRAKERAGCTDVAIYNAVRAGKLMAIYKYPKIKRGMMIPLASLNRWIPILRRNKERWKAS